MQDLNASTCGHETVTGAACPDCGHAAGDGAARHSRVESPAPPEAANWVITPTPPEMLKSLRETFDEAEFIAALREVEKTGGVQIRDLIDDIERKINASA